MLFDSEHLFIAALVSTIRGESGSEEGLDDFPGESGSDDSFADTKDVHVVMFYALCCGVGIMADSCAQTRMLVDGDADPDAAAADQDSSFGLVLHEGFCQHPGKVGIIVLPIVFKRPDIQDLMAAIAKVCGNELFQFESSVVATDSYLQGLPSFPPGLQLPGYRRNITSWPVKRNDTPISPAGFLACRCGFF